jgi:hypothetical protein
MKSELIRRARKWSLYGAVLTAMAYSALTLTSQPAYAGTCTTVECQGLHNFCTAGCALQGGVKTFWCVAGGISSVCQCNFGGLHVTPC